MQRAETPETEPVAHNPVLLYLKLTRGAWYGFLFALPILVGYEILEFVFKPPWLNGADAILRLFLAPFGSTERSTILLIVLLVCGFLCWQFDGARKRYQGGAFRPEFLLGMFTESFVYALFLGEVVSRMMYFLSGQWVLQMGGGGGGVLFNLTMALGAGIYEELLFRVLIMGGIILLLVNLCKVDKLLSWVIAVLVSSLIFSAFHYIGGAADVFTLESFLFRFLAGAVLASLYAARGFGIAVWTHALYDLLVMFHVRG